MLRASHRSDALVFALALVGAGYFHQGGGWNQNSRFAMVRAVVEGHTLSIDDYIIYRKDPSTAQRLERVPAQSANLSRSGSEVALAWRGSAGSLVPIDGAAAGNRKLVAAEDIAATGDLAYKDGHFYPNKAPGASLLAVPGYALVRMVEALFGADPDAWSVLTWNAWLASLLSVGVAMAIGAVLVLRLARGMASELSARLAALCFAFATMALPLGTMLHEHDIIAVALLACLYFIETAGDGSADAAARRLAAAGFCAGYAAITNYTMALVVPMFAIYLYWKRRGARRLQADALAFGCGVLIPLLVICAYNITCFGTPLTTNYAWQSPTFTAESRFLGVFALPRTDVLLALLVSPYRGLFFSSPILLLSVAAMVGLWRAQQRRPLVLLIAAVTAFVVAVNASFNGWDGGWIAVPRYLAPAVGLLSLPIAVAFDRWQGLASGLAAVSLLIQLTMTIVDPQVPMGDAGAAGLPVSSVFGLDPMQRYVVPLFTTGHAWPLLDEMINRSVAKTVQAGLQRGDATADIENKSSSVRADLRSRIEQGQATPFELAGVVGPVSANPIGIYEGYYYRLFPANSPETLGNSFNLGELMFPASRLSLLPLLLAATVLLILLFQSDEEAVAEPASKPVPSPPARPNGRPSPGDRPSPSNRASDRASPSDRASDRPSPSNRPSDRASPSDRPSDRARRKKP
ncbi:MAG TPA: glycosyltransferase family 39 protein [Candidatus Binatia bacterium]